MTDEQIIKALECHKESDLDTCTICPLLNIQDCAYKLSGYALELVNRQKAEVEKLKEQVNLWQEEADSVGCANEWLKACLKEKNAEVERLQADNKAMMQAIAFRKEITPQFVLMNDDDEAFAELAKRLKMLKSVVMSPDNASIVCVDVDKIKAEAIKEFAEKLKTEQSFYDGQETRIYLTEKDLDNLIKEMTEPSLLDKKFGGDTE